MNGWLYVPSNRPLYDTHLTKILSSREGWFYLLSLMLPLLSVIPLSFPFFWKLFFRIINPVVTFEVMDRQHRWYEVMWIYRNGRRQFHYPGFSSLEEAQRHAIQRLRNG